MERDDQSLRNDYSTNPYIATLEQGLVAVYESGKVFQQDNVRIHMSGVM